MPKPKTQKQLEAREKLIKEYRIAKAQDPLSYRSTMLWTQIRNLNDKLGFTDYSLEVEE